MNMRRFAKIAASGLIMGVVLTGGHAAGGDAEHASPSDAKAVKLAAKSAAKAEKALAHGDFAGAVFAAEEAVSYAPRDPAFRMTLAQAYLGAGRFAAAGTSFADVLTLQPDNARAALNLALTQIARGDKDAALSTLGDYREKLTAADYGLAAALAGDTDNGVRTLEQAIRGGGADAKVRQNLALAYALAGKWTNARVMAMQDLTPSEADARIIQWTGFVRPQSSYDQVASLLGVAPVEDAGQPTRLALNAVARPAVQQAATEVAPVPDTAAAIEAAQPAAAFEVAVTKAPESPVTVAAATPSAPAIIMAERREIVQPLPAAPAPVIRAAQIVPKQAIVPVAKPAPRFVQAAIAAKPAGRRFEGGRFVVQLGAFQNAAVSRDAWGRLSRRYALADHVPANATARVRGATFVRLSVGGFATRADANLVCTRIQKAGGSCFVRGSLGDAPAQWVQRGMSKTAKPVRIASR